jgi:hypothetical protein
MQFDESLDRTNLEEYAGATLKALLDFVQQKKDEGLDSVLCPWYIPLNQMKHLDGYKRFVLQGLIDAGNHVTDYLPEFRDEIGGVIRDVLICWTDQAKAKAESEGIVFKTY